MARQWTNCFNSSNVHEPISKCRATLGLRIFTNKREREKVETDVIIVRRL